MDESVLGVVSVTLGLAICGVMLASMWKLFVKAGKPGWACLVPIYNVVVMLQIAEKPVWWLLLYLIPLVGTVVVVIVTIEFAKAFGKGVGFGIGLILLGFIFYPLLAFGDAEYEGA